MLHLLLAVLQIAWSGAGFPTNFTGIPPAIVAHPPEGRTPHGAIELRAVQDGRRVPAEFSVSPDEALSFNGSQIRPALYRGPATIRARFGKSSAELPAFVYDSAAVGCSLGFSNGLRFDEDGVVHAAGNPREADIYVAGPSNSPRMDLLAGCSGAFVRRDPDFSLHMPYGATIVPRSTGVYFGYVRTGDFHGEYTTVASLHPGDVIIFRTHSGRFVKMLDYEPSAALSGAYLQAPLNAQFADYAFYSRHRYVPHALFGVHQ